jgi:hypothetical protein
VWFWKTDLRHNFHIKFHEFPFSHSVVITRVRTDGSDLVELRYVRQYVAQRIMRNDTIIARPHDFKQPSHYNKVLKPTTYDFGKLTYGVISIQNLKNFLQLFFRYYVCTNGCLNMVQLCYSVVQRIKAMTSSSSNLTISTAVHNIEISTQFQCPSPAFLTRFNLFKIILKI